MRLTARVSMAAATCAAICDALGLHEMEEFSACLPGEATLDEGKGRSGADEVGAPKPAGCGAATDELSSAAEGRTRQELDDCASPSRTARSACRVDALWADGFKPVATGCGAAVSSPDKWGKLQRKCCCSPMTDPGRMIRNQAMASRALKP